MNILFVLNLFFSNYQLKIKIKIQEFRTKNKCVHNIMSSETCKWGYNCTPCEFFESAKTLFGSENKTLNII